MTVRVNRGIVLLIFAAALAIRVPLRSQLSFYWDSAQFALAVESFDLTIGVPHPPGYFLYVMLGRLLNQLVGDPHTTLVWMSLVFGSALPVAFYLLGKATYSRTTGLVAAAIGATSAIPWFYSLIVYTYVVDAFYVTLFALLCWQARSRGVPWKDVIALSALYALILGTRQQSGVTLAPLLAFTLWGASDRRFLKIAGALVASGSLVLLWFIPLTASAGGIYAYFEIAQAHVSATRASIPLLDLVLGNFNRILRFVITGLLLGFVMLVAAAVAQMKDLESILSRRRPSPRFWFFFWWLAPMLAFWSLVFTDLPGHAMSYLCGLIILTAAALDAAARRIGRFAPGLSPGIIAAILTSGVVLFNVWTFLSRPPFVNGLIAHIPVTAYDIRKNDERLAHTFRFVREHYRVEDVALCHSAQFFVGGFRQYQYHLPEYLNLLLKPDPALPPAHNKDLWIGEHRETRFSSQLPRDARPTLLLVVPPDGTLDMFSRWFDVGRAIPVEGSDGALFEYPSRGE